MGNSSASHANGGGSADGTLPSQPASAASSSNGSQSGAAANGKPSAKSKNVKNRMMARFGQHRKQGGRSASIDAEPDRFVVVGVTADGARPKRPTQLTINRQQQQQHHHHQQHEQLFAAVSPRNAASLAMPESGSEESSPSSSVDADERRCVAAAKDAVHGKCRRMSYC